ncbi:hypothetical protein SAMN02745111_01984 [Eubacterium uniforme]|uniref:Uncharacterized protein n=1 Tax=Eubacterium uniforme TaxID=39495 RepID=A0A1T4VYZ5_9FIRM|nr:hypothetical protein [Eubacterium uniforme]SKA70240.1 hypothetical protein SAMN02745111_01984 [Eubacterium uniforme]
MKKKISIVLLIILSVVLLKIISYSSLERKIILANINHFVEIDFGSVYVNEKEHVIEVTFKRLEGRGKENKIVKKLVNNSFNIIFKRDKYKDYKMKFRITKASRPEFVVIKDSQGHTEEVYFAINRYRKRMAFSYISQYYSDVKILRLDDMYTIYDEYCDVNNYKKFTNLEKVSFSKKPSDEVINYIKEKFPNCLLEYDNE